MDKKTVLLKAQNFHKAKILESNAHELLLKSKGIKHVSIDCDSGIVFVEYWESMPWTQEERNEYERAGNPIPSEKKWLKHKFTFSFNQFFGGI